MIVNLAVEDQDGVAIVADHGLIAALQIDDLEAHRAQGNDFRFVGTLLVRTAMNQRVGSRANTCGVEYAAAVRKPGYAAQVTLLRPSEKHCFTGWLLPPIRPSDH